MCSSDLVLQGHLWPPGGMTAEQRLRHGGFDMDRLKQKIIAEAFTLYGPTRLAKAIPINPQSGLMPYPPGSGIPWWKLVKPLPFRVIELIGPGKTYSGTKRDAFRRRSFGEKTFERRT